MKKYLFLWILLLLGQGSLGKVWAQNSSYATPKSLHFEQTSLKSILTTIGTTWQIGMSYSDSLIQAERIVSFSTTHADLKSTLDSLSAQFHLKYLLKKGNVLLRPAPKTSLPRATLTGQLTDATTGEPLPGGVVVLPTLRMGANTDNEGRFEIAGIPPGTHSVESRYLGYTTVTQEFNFTPDATKTWDIQLQPRAIELEEAVEISDRITDPTTVSEVILAREDLKIAQGVSGDPFRTLTSLPGFVGNGGALGTSQISVRGGMPEETLYLIDNAPMLNPWHVTGNSVFNPELIEKMEVLSSGYGVSYGNSMSGVVNLTTKEGNMKRFSGKLNLGEFNTNFMAEGPIIKEKLSFITALRGSYYNRFFPAYSVAYPQFSDLNLKITGRPHPNHKILFSGLFTSAFSRKGIRPGLPENSALQGRTWNTSLQWQGALSEKLYHKLSLTHSKALSTGRFGTVQDDRFVQVNDILRDDFTIFVNSTNRIKLGFDYAKLNYAYAGFAPLDPLVTDFADTSITVAVPDTLNRLRNRFGAYLLFDGKVLPRVRINGGMRIDRLHLQFQDGLVDASPRLSIAYEVNSRSELRASAGYYHQNPTYRALLNRPDLLSNQSVQYVLGYTYRFPFPLFFWVEAYYKDYSRLVIFDEEFNYSNAGKGSSYGAEVFIRREAGQVRGWLSYAFAQSQRRGNLLTTIEAAPFDRRHTVSLILEYRPQSVKRIIPKVIGSNFQLGTGNPYTPQIGASLQGNEWVGLPGDPFSARNPLQHNLTVRMEWEKVWQKPKRRYALHWSLEVWNVYNHQNLAGRAYQYGPGYPNFVQENPYFSASVFPWLGLEFEIQ